MEKLSDLKKRRSAIEQGGGSQAIEKQHSQSKLFVRERIDALLDEGTFIETDTFVSHRCVDYRNGNIETPADGVVTGYGTISGRPVCIYAQDYTVVGGSLGEMHAKKICKTIDLAMKTGVPVIGLFDSSGTRIEEGLNALNGLGEILKKMSDASGVVPQISVAMGPLAGIASCVLPMSDFAFMVDGTSHLFMNGPNVIKGSTNSDITAQNLGGAKVHAEKSGIANFTFANDEECLNAVKALLNYLPDNNLSDTSYYENADDINRLSEALNAFVNADNVDMKTVIAEISDNGEFLEVSERYSSNVITGFAFLNGSSSAIVAASGELDINGLDKTTKFVRFCDSFNIPIITLTDVSGFVVSKKQEMDGIVRYATKLISAFAQATVPKVNVIVGKAYGGAHLAFGSKYIGADLVFAWPGAEVSIMPSDGAANILFKDDLAVADNPMEERKAKIEEYKNEYANPYNAAKLGFVDNVIEPSTTRPVLISALEMLSGKRETRPAKKHNTVN